MKAKEENDGPVSAPEEDPTYFERECSSSWFVIETVIEDVGDILRRHGHRTAAECLRSAHIDFSSNSSFAMEELRDGDFDECNRDEIHLDYIRGSSLQELQKEAAHDEVMLRFLLDRINSQYSDALEGVEKKRSKAIEYLCERLSRSARGVAYHTCREQA